jgi:hypothetical protein
VPQNQHNSRQTRWNFGLGHSSIKVTEKHYAPWVKARQEQLEADVVRIWERDAVAKGTPQVHGEKTVLKFRAIR